MATGTATLDFGSAGGDYVTADVTGLSGLSAATHLEAWMQGDTSANHDATDHAVIALQLRCEYLTASSFRVHARSLDGVLFGAWTVHYATL